MEKIVKIGTGNARPTPKDASPVYAEDYDKVVDSLNNVIDNTPTTNQIIAIQKANAPSSTNAFVTMSDLTGATGSFTAGANTITVVNGFITEIV